MFRISITVCEAFKTSYMYRASPEAEYKTHLCASSSKYQVNPSNARTWPFPLVSRGGFRGGAEGARHPPRFQKSKILLIFNRRFLKLYFPGAVLNWFSVLSSTVISVYQSVWITEAIGEFIERVKLFLIHGPTVSTRKIFFGQHPQKWSPKSAPALPVCVQGHIYAGKET